MTISDTIMRWIQSWLKEKLQQVMLTGEFSGWRVVVSDVSQGSVLGHILFNILLSALVLKLDVSS